MSEEMIAHTIANIGVPTAICFYVLFTLNKSVTKLNDNLNAFTKSLVDWNKLVEQRIQRLEDAVLKNPH